MSETTKQKRLSKNKLVLLVLAAVVVLLLIYLVPVTKPIQKTLPCTHYSADETALENGEMQINLSYKNYLIKPDTLSGNITLFFDTGERIVEVDLSDAESILRHSTFMGFTYDAGEPSVAFINYEDDFDACSVSIEGEVYSSPKIK
ncbi:MAG: hypothetical protein J6I98_02540 [Clostridia bacterium]|nr:hypothetical protein [Clostridia bacterium]